MIVVDSSALLAIFEGEPDAATFATVIAQADRLLISAVNAYETGIVLRVRHGDAALARLCAFFSRTTISRSSPSISAGRKRRSPPSVASVKASIPKLVSTSPIARPMLWPNQ